MAAAIQPAERLNYKLHNGVNHQVREETRIGELLSPRYVEKGDDLVIVQIPAFALSVPEVDDVISRMRKHKAAILDLRSNPSGFGQTLARMLGGLFQNDLKVLDRVERTKTESVSASGRTMKLLPAASQS